MRTLFTIACVLQWSLAGYCPMMIPMTAHQESAMSHADMSTDAHHEIPSSPICNGDCPMLLPADDRATNAMILSAAEVVGVQAFNTHFYPVWTGQPQPAIRDVRPPGSPIQTFLASVVLRT